MNPPDVVDDLEAEQDQLDALLGRLSPAEWTAPSAAAGWTVADVVLHLAQTEEVVPVAIEGASLKWGAFGDSVDSAMDAMVRSQPAPPAEIFERWRTAPAIETRLATAKPDDRTVNGADQRGRLHELQSPLALNLVSGVR